MKEMKLDLNRIGELNNVPIDCSRCWTRRRWHELRLSESLRWKDRFAGAPLDLAFWCSAGPDSASIFPFETFSETLKPPIAMSDFLFYFPGKVAGLDRERERQRARCDQSFDGWRWNDEITSFGSGNAVAIQYFG